MISMYFKYLICAVLITVTPNYAYQQNPVIVPTVNSASAIYDSLIKQINTDLKKKDSGDSKRIEELNKLKKDKKKIYAINDTIYIVLYQTDTLYLTKKRKTLWEIFNLKKCKK